MDQIKIYLKVLIYLIKYINYSINNLKNNINKKYLKIKNKNLFKQKIY